MITLKNDFLTVIISEIGAEMQSIVMDEKELLWQGDPAFWAKRAPVLFPICGGLKNDKYTFGDKEYTLEKHGFARSKTFSSEALSDTSAVFTLTPDKDTLTMYPFNWELKIIYTLNGASISIEYRVTNNSDTVMPYSIGSHEGYALDGDIENYELVFEKDEDFNASVLDGNLLTYDTAKAYESGKILPLCYKYFEIDALVFTSLKSRSVTLRNKTDNSTVTVDFKNCPYLLLWTKPNAPYLCIEPWTGLPDYVDETGVLTEKKTAALLEKGKTDTVKHTITFSK